MWLKLIFNKYLWLGLIITGLLGSTTYLYHRNKQTRLQLEQAATNVKAYASSLDSAANAGVVFKFTIDQLKYYNDSILQRMDKVRQELKIKDKELVSMQYMLSQASKIDTITLKDTIFRDVSFALDTLMGDKWYTLKLGLKYPNRIIVQPTFISEVYVITNAQKETIAPPKKFFISRWLQKKHRVLRGQVIEKNPYSALKETRFIEIVK